MHNIFEQTGEFADLVARLHASRIGAVWGLYAVILGAGMIVAVWLAARAWKSQLDWSARVQALAGRPWTWRDARLLALILVLAHLVLRCVNVWGLAPPDLPLTVRALMGVSSLHIAALAAITVMLRARGLGWADVFGHCGRGRMRAAGTGALLYLAVMPMVFFAALLFNFYLMSKGVSLDAQDVVELFFTEGPLLPKVTLAVAAVTIVPAAEEAIFRGVALPLAARVFGIGPAIAAVSVLFAVIHLHLPSMAPLVVLAVAFSLAYLWSGCLLVPMVMHAVFNGVTLVALLLISAP